MKIRNGFVSNSSSSSFQSSSSSSGMIIGNDCDTCEPTLWADGETPLYVQVVYSGITSCNATTNANVTGILKQKSTDPCYWEASIVLNGDFWYMSYTLNAAYSIVTLVYAGGGSYFDSGLEIVCDVTFTNGWTVCSGAPVFGINGIASVVWGASIGQAGYDAQTFWA